ncbi:MAG: universal stress protein [Bryobacteraceae bacterium]|jgi:nucleotide-binding universal stress UspA family protein
MPFTSILFPVDFSERSRAIVPHVKAACARFQASLTMLHLVEVPAMAYGTPEAPVVFEFPLEEMKETAEEKLCYFAESEFPGMAVRTVVDEGDPGSCIPELARIWQNDLIMLPTRGQGRFRAALLGSVTAKILHDATCAVWTASHCDSMAAAQHTDWRKIVCAIDTVPEGSRLIRYAAQLADAGATVQLAHAVPVAEAGVEKYLDLEFAAFLKDQAREAVAAMQKEAGTNFEVLIEAGNIPEAVRRAAEAQRADIVLIGRGALPHFAGRLRSHAYAIVRDMPCPVLSV